MADAAASYPFRGDPLCLWPSQCRPGLWYRPTERALGVSGRSVAEYLVGQFTGQQLPEASHFMLGTSVVAEAPPPPSSLACRDAKAHLPRGMVQSRRSSTARSIAAEREDTPSFW
jgi:hypothetical protein